MTESQPDERDQTTEDVRPLMGVSRCLGFAPCRWDGAIVLSPEVAELAPYVELRPICPEVEMGLGVPRDPIRIVSVQGVRRLVQPATGRDLTEAIESVVRRCAADLAPADGLILKGRSPSCGLYDTRVYASASADEALDETSRGLFAAGMLAHLPHLAVEDEVGLRDPGRRDHFLTRLFALARYRVARAEGSPAALVRYQTENKLLLMGYDKDRLGAMGRLVAAARERPMAETLDAYAGHLHAALAEPARASTQINALMHAVGYLRESLTCRERADFLEMLDGYRRGNVPLSACRALLASWVVRYGAPYLARQTYLRPYPEALVRAS